MMVITAKFSSRCLDCGHQVRRGELVEWRRGKPITHVNCSDQDTVSWRRGGGYVRDPGEDAEDRWLETHQ